MGGRAENTIWVWRGLAWDTLWNRVGGRADGEELEYMGTSKYKKGRGRDMVSRGLVGLGGQGFRILWNRVGGRTDGEKV